MWRWSSCKAIGGECVLRTVPYFCRAALVQRFRLYYLTTLPATTCKTRRISNTQLFSREVSSHTPLCIVEEKERTRLAMAMQDPGCLKGKVHSTAGAQVQSCWQSEVVERSTCSVPPQRTKDQITDHESHHARKTGVSEFRRG